MEAAGAVSLLQCAQNVSKAITFSPADASHATLHAAHATRTYRAQAVHADFALTHHPNASHAPPATAHHAVSRTSVNNVCHNTTCKPAPAHVSYSTPINPFKTAISTQAISTTQSLQHMHPPPSSADFAPPTPTSTHKQTPANHAHSSARPALALTALPNALHATLPMRDSPTLQQVYAPKGCILFKTKKLYIKIAGMMQGCIIEVGR